MGGWYTRWVSGVKNAVVARVQLSLLQNADCLVYDIILVCRSRRLYVLYYFVLEGNIALGYRAFGLHLKIIIFGCHLLSLYRYFLGWPFATKSWLFLPKTAKTTPLVCTRRRSISTYLKSQSGKCVYQFYYELYLLLYIVGLEFYLSRWRSMKIRRNKYVVIFLEIMFFNVPTYTILLQIVCITLHWLNIKLNSNTQLYEIMYHVRRTIKLLLLVSLLIWKNKSLFLMPYSSHDTSCDCRLS